MFYFTDGPTDENVFAFYDDLVLASLTQFQHEYLRLVAEWTVEGEIDDDIAFHHGGHMPDIDKYYKYISKTQSKKLFKAIETEIENQPIEDEKKRFALNIFSKITYYVHKIKQNKNIVEPLAFIEDLEVLKTDIKARFPEIFETTDVSKNHDNIFSFYSELVTHGTGILASGFADFISDQGEEGDIVEYCMNRGLSMTNENYSKGVSHFQSNEVFHKINKQIAVVNDCNRRQNYWNKIKPEIEFYVVKLSDKLKNNSFFASDLSQVITDIELRFKELNDTSPSQEFNEVQKLKWLGNTNVLATLFYDLWKGQEKLKSGSTKPMIETSKGAMLTFLTNNFVDKDNKPLNESSLNDYLNQSKSEKRAKEGKRIELEIPG